MPDPTALVPIIYVRGYAMTPSEIDETTADPFCGFNLGSTVYRAVPDRNLQPRKLIFESPVVRLATDYGYADVYQDGYDILDPEWRRNNSLSRKSILIFRYYDESSRLLGSGAKPDITEFSRRLGEFIISVRDLVCQNDKNGVTPETFRCYLVAHSMGGLVCRGLLQNQEIDRHNARHYVDKFFTYATPHNGIDLAGVNAPSWLSLWGIDTFNREKMAQHLNLTWINDESRVDRLREDLFPPERVFCMVGTNRSDYEVAKGLSRTFAGHGSDGLVRIENATLTGLKANGDLGEECAKAFAYRSHSGYFGIVNSEEAYQNLIRFLFGNVRADIWLDIDEITLPEHVAAAGDAGTLNALYQVELTASPRGMRWYLTRRSAEEDSVACVSYREWSDKETPKKHLYLSTVFLLNRAKVKPDSDSLAYSISLGVRVPDYEVDRRFRPDEHYEGGYLFRDTLKVVIQETSETTRNVVARWQTLDKRIEPRKVDVAELVNNKIEVAAPFESTTASGGIAGTLRFVVSAWNAGLDTGEN